jgi:hypothetical protein
MNVWVPTETPVAVHGDVQDAKGAASSAHSKAGPPGAVNDTLANVLVDATGREVIVGAGRAVVTNV